jgi:hypothetical protein
MSKKYKPVLAILLILVIITAFLPGCAVSPAYNNSGDRNINPFFFDHVANVRIVLPETDWQSLIANAFTKDYYKADFWFDSQLVPDVAVRTKGNASLQETARWNSERFPLAIDFNLLNKNRTFHGIKKLHFNNGWSDPTLIRDVISLFGRGRLMLSVDQPAYGELEAKLSSFLKERLPGQRLVSMSVMDNRVSLNYQYRRHSSLDWATFAKDLNQLAGTAKVEMFIG